VAVLYRCGLDIHSSTWWKGEGEGVGKEGMKAVGFIGVMKKGL
jgi:hypothetical protein